MEKLEEFVKELKEDLDINGEYYFQKNKTINWATKEIYQTIDELYIKFTSS